MRRVHLLLSLFVSLLVVIFSVQMGFASPAFGGKQPPPPPPPPAPAALPALPDATVISAVIMGGGPTWTAIGAPPSVLNDVDAFNQAPFAGLRASLDVANTVAYIGDKGEISFLAIPLQNSTTRTLAPEITAPDDGAPAQIVGVVASSSGTQIAVAAWPTGATSGLPSEVRLYTSNTSHIIYPYGITLRAFSTPPIALEGGVVIARREACFVVGINQVCGNTDAPFTGGKPPKGDKGSAEELARDNQLSQANDRLKAAYNFTVDFDFNASVPDLAGSGQRSQCASYFASQNKDIKWDSAKPCTPSMWMTSSTTNVPGQPIGIFHLTQPNAMQAYRTNGQYVGTLPAGDYLVMDATPSSAANQPGSVGALFLVNADHTNNFLIPAYVMRTFADPVNAPANYIGQAGIKGGYCWSRGF